MCLAVPMRVVEVGGTEAIVEAGGTRQRISLVLLENVTPGDYVIVHAGYAIEKLDESAAHETLELMRQLAEGRLAQL